MVGNSQKEQVRDWIDRRLRICSIISVSQPFWSNAAAAAAEQGLETADRHDVGHSIAGPLSSGDGQSASLRRAGSIR